MKNPETTSRCRWKIAIKNDGFKKQQLEQVKKKKRRRGSGAAKRRTNKMRKTSQGGLALFS